MEALKRSCSFPSLIIRIILKLSPLLYITRGGKISEKGQNWSMEFLKNNHLDNITSMNKGP